MKPRAKTRLINKVGELKPYYQLLIKQHRKTLPENSTWIEETKHMNLKDVLISQAFDWDKFGGWYEWITLIETGDYGPLEKSLKQKKFLIKIITNEKNI